MHTLAETIKGGIRYSLHPDDMDTAALLRDYEDYNEGVLAVQSWDRWGWHTVWAREGIEIIGSCYDDEAERAANLARGIHLHYAAGYCKGDVIRIAHNGALSQESADLIHSLVFDGVAYAKAERWTDTGFEVINSIGGLDLMDGPDATLDRAINDYLKNGE